MSHEPREAVMVRRPAVSGTFYAGTPERLRAQLDGLLPATRTGQPAIGVVVPHAGYVYSGRVAAAVYARLAFPETCVILGPNHTGLGAGVSVMTQGEWETPLGRLAIDTELAEAIRAQSPAIVDDPVGHQREHSIEVQLPFLQYLKGPSRFVPLCLFRHDLPACQEVGRAVAVAVRNAGRPVVLIASTDMSHYVSRAEATAKDRHALDAILRLDPAGLHAAVVHHGIGMCGYHAVTAMLVAARAMGAARAELVMYGDSGDAAGDTSQVVAYAGMLVT
jgi:AmmeMemoRadiSam system protein B